MSLDTLISQGQIPYEEDLLKNSDDETLWLEYFESVAGNFEKSRFILERATSQLPASALLWNAYLSLPWTPNNRKTLIQLYEKALNVLNHTPAFWHEYIDLLAQDNSESGRVRFKNALDEALINLHMSHHGKIWHHYLNFAQKSKPKLSALIYARYFEAAGSDISDMPSVSREECVLKVAQLGNFKKAIEIYEDLNKGKSHVSVSHTEFKLDFLRTLSADPEFLAHQFVEKFANDAARDSPEFASKFFLEVAAYHSARNNLDSARHFHTLSFSHADSVSGVVAVFTTVSNWEENQIEKLYRKVDTGKEGNLENPENHENEAIIEELKYRLKLFRYLIDQQPILINDVLLQKSPHSIDHWLDRVAIYVETKNEREVINTYVTAIRRINPLKATSKKGHTMASIWIKYAEKYVSVDDLSTANVIYSHAVRSQYKSVHELAELYIAWTEMIFSVSDDEALQHIESVLFVPEPEPEPNPNPKHSVGDSKNNTSNTDSGNGENTKIATKPSIHDQLHTCTDLWSFYIDMLKSMLEEDGNNSKIYQKLRNSYNRLLSLQIITLKSLLDYADFMGQHEGLKNSYEIYEKGIQNFCSPQAQYHIWNVYLEKETKNEKNADIVRDLFERCLSSGIPGFQIYEIYQKRCDFETRMGNLVQTVKIMRDAIAYLTRTYSSPRYTKVNRNKIADDKFTLYTKAGHVIRHSLADNALYREVMSEALQDIHLTLPSVISLGLEYIDFEENLKEHHRVRALFKYLCGLSHPETHVMKKVWEKWEQWEVVSGTEASFKQVLKTRRQMADEFKGISDLKADINPMGFVLGESKKESKAEEEKTTTNPDVIELDMDM